MPHSQRHCFKYKNCLGYLLILHSEGSSCDIRLVSVDLHDQPPAHVAPSGLDKSIGLGELASGSFVGTK